MEQLFPDWNFEDNFHMSTNKRSIRPEDELVELLWRDGQVILQSQARREEPIQQVQTHKQETLRKHNNQEPERKPNNTFLEDQETVSWIQYPPEDVVDPFESEFSSHLFSSIDHLNSAEKLQTIKETVAHEAQTMAPPKFRSQVRPSLCGSNQSTNNHQLRVGPARMVVNSDKSKNVEERVLDTSSGGSSGCSYGKNMKETGSGRSVNVDRKRKHVIDSTDQESVSQSDIRMVSTDDQTMGNNSSQRSGSTRRSRAAEVHNLSERRRRDRINERMKALQELIPHSTKTDKASILDEAIDYLKTLQMQLQVMWMGSGMAAAAAAAATTPMLFPGVQSSPYMNQMRMQNPMQLPQFPVIDRSNPQNHPGLVCQNPVQFQIQAQNQILSEQLARYMGGFPQMQPPTSQMQVMQQQPMDMLRFGSPTVQQSQLSAPATTDKGKSG